MKTHVRFILTITLLFPLLLYAQGEQNIWMVNAVPLGGTRNGIDFTSGAPQFIHFSNPPYNFTGNTSASNAICNTSGQPLFFTNGKTVYDRTGQVLPNGADLAYPGGGTSYSMPPLIMPVPGQSNRYAIFTHRNGGLHYTLVDMSANSGRGAVMPQYKNVLLNNLAGRDGITMNAKTVSVKGCAGNWLVYRSRYAKEFRAFLVTSAGVQPDPVISNVGLLPVGDYEGDVYQGVLKASPDGRKLAIVAKGAIELYDFDRCSGQVTNSMLVADDGDYYYGLCFSPDNTKLYATTRDWPGRVYQFDLSLSAPTAIRASKTLVFTNPTYWTFNILLGWVLQRGPLGDIKTGSDGKIYFANGFTSPANAYTQPTSLSPSYGHRLHVINEPNRAGLACNAVRDILPLNGPVGIDLPPDIVLPGQQDTVYGSLRQIVACFHDSLRLQADTPGSCYRWDDGSDQSSRIVGQSGIYTVQYTDENCTLHIDRFDVRFVTLPEIAPATYSCPNEPSGGITIIAIDNTKFNYTWSNGDGLTIREGESDRGDTLRGVTSGRYSVHLTTVSGCDTTLYAEVLPLPLPPVSFDADTVVCKGIPLTFTNTSDVLVWEWHSGDGTKSVERHLVYTYAQAGVYPAMLVTKNVEGCRDTVVKNIHVKELLLSMTATPDLLNMNESTVLQTSAPEPHRITAWLPERFFADQSAYSQRIEVDTSRAYTVIGESAHGCVDTASVVVTTHSVVYMPTAFSPNSDGRNDLFRPAIRGDAVTIRSFHIFDRWGREVWNGQGSSDAVGWDGSHNGSPAQVGTYYYTIEAETHTGKTIREKGDVTLIR